MYFSRDSVAYAAEYDDAELSCTAPLGEFMTNLDIMILARLYERSLDQSERTWDDAERTWNEFRSTLNL